MFFAGREKTVERERVFANVSVNEQRDFGVKFAERGIGGKRNGNDVADAAHIDEHLVGPFVSEAAAKLSDHRSAVLPLFFRPSTREVRMAFDQAGAAEGAASCRPRIRARE